MPELIEDASIELTGPFRVLIDRLMDQLKELGCVDELDANIKEWHRASARSVISAAKRKKDKVEGWLSRLIERRNVNVAALALANKNARIVWALLAPDREFRADYTSAAAAA